MARVVNILPYKRQGPVYCLTYTVKSTADDDLVMRRASESAAIVLALFSGTCSEVKQHVVHLHVELKI